MENINSIIYNAAIYLRLSREDGDVAEGSKLVSNSISNQKALVMDFLKSHTEIKVHSVYADDGYKTLKIVCKRTHIFRLALVMSRIHGIILFFIYAFLLFGLL